MNHTNISEENSQDFLSTYLDKTTHISTHTVSLFQLVYKNPSKSKQMSCLVCCSYTLFWIQCTFKLTHKLNIQSDFNARIEFRLCLGQHKAPPLSSISFCHTRKPHTTPHLMWHITSCIQIHSHKTIKYHTGVGSTESTASIQTPEQKHPQEWKTFSHLTINLIFHLGNFEFRIHI